MLKRLGTDRSITPLVAQFVPLKVETVGTSWQQWASKYRAEGNGIPIIYVIRADGQMMYGRTGSLPGDELPRLLILQLQSAGKIFSDAQSAAVAKAVQEANSAVEKEDYVSAVRKLVSLKRIGSLGQLGSYAQPALEADQLAKTLVETAHTRLAEIEQQLGSEKFAALVMFVEVRRAFSALPMLKLDLTKAARKYGKDPELRELFKQAESFARASALTRAENTRKRGIAALERIVQRDADSPAAQAAGKLLSRFEDDRLAVTEPHARKTPEKMPAGKKSREFRMWTDVSGEYRVQARLVRVDGNQVVLCKKDGGTVVTVPLGKLSAADRRYAASHRKSR